MTSIQEALGRLWNAADDARMLQCDGQWVTWGQVRALTERIDRELTRGGLRSRRTSRRRARQPHGVGGRDHRDLPGRAHAGHAQPTAARRAAQRRSRRVRRRLRAGAGRLYGANRYSSTPSPNSGPRHSASTERRGHLRAEATREPRDGDPAIAIEMLTSGTTGPGKAHSVGTQSEWRPRCQRRLQHNNRPEVRDKPPLTGRRRDGDPSDRAHRRAVVRCCRRWWLHGPS